MKRSFVIVIILIAIITINYLPAAIFASVPDDLKKAIQEKSNAINEVNSQILAAQKELEGLQGQKQTLQKELSGINYGIKQISLGIRSTEINIEKLKLEIESLGYDITDTEDKIGLQKSAVIKIFRTLQEKDDEGLLLIFLENATLSESFLEAQSLININNNLSLEINNLRRLKEDLGNNLKAKSDKKQLIELENQNLKNKKLVLGDQKFDKQTLLEKTKNQEKNYQSLLTDLEKKQAEIAAEVEKIEEELRRSIDPSLLPSKRPGVLLMPVNGKLTQNFGITPFSRAGGYRGEIHNGIDIGAPVGTPISAAEDGKVIAIGDQDKYCYRGAYGKFILIEHENNLTTLYAHLSRQIVKENDIIKRGDLIGYVGKTGYATGPHLHFTVYGTPVLMKQSRVCGLMPFGGYLNPMDYL